MPGASVASHSGLAGRSGGRAASAPGARRVDMPPGFPFAETAWRVSGFAVTAIEARMMAQRGRVARYCRGLCYAAATLRWLMTGDSNDEIKIIHVRHRV